MKLRVARKVIVTALVANASLQPTRQRQGTWLRAGARLGLARLQEVVQRSTRVRRALERGVVGEIFDDRAARDAATEGA